MTRTAGALLKKILALMAFALVTSSSALAAEGGCHTIAGTHVNRSVPCPVPAVGCVESQVTGDFEGTSLTVITYFDPAAQIYSGTWTTVLTNGAVVEGTIVGWMGSVITFTGGTRQFAHATGTLVTTPPVGADGTYTGENCLGTGGSD